MSPRWSIAWKLLASYGLVLLVTAAMHLLVAYPLASGDVAAYTHEAGMVSALSDHLQERLLRSFLWAGLAAIVVAAGVALPLARGITQPIQHMVEATRRIAAGDYRERVAVASRDELGQLAAALNEMATGLERVEGLRRELVGNVAHELRTPLAGLEGYLEGLADGIFAPTPETLARMRAETARLRRLVEDLTELSQLESGRWQLQRRPVDLAHVAAAVEDTLRPQFARKGVGLEVRLAERLPRLPGDADRLGQMLTNLLVNALRFTPPGGRVIVEAWGELDAVGLAVSDTGSGIAPEDLPHVFERFYRADRARAQATGGSGIGLAIVKHIVEAHGGTVTVRSDLDRGSRFEVRLPLVAAFTAQAPTHIRGAQPDRNLTPV